MGRCISVEGPPQQVNIQLPGGIKISSMTNGSQQIPNSIDPFQSVLQMASPALGSLKVSFDIINCIMAFVDLMIAILEIVGVLLIPTGNIAINQMFPLKNAVNKEENDPFPGQPKGDLGFPDPTHVVTASIRLIVCAVKLVGLIPQLSAAATIKDSVLQIIGMMEAVMGQINSITDKLALIPPPSTGDSLLDFELSCANDNIQIEIEHQLGPLAQLVPMVAVLDLISKPLRQGLPAPVATLLRTAVGMDLIPLADDAAKENLLSLIDTMETQGLPIELPDFSDLSDIPAKIDQIKSVLGPDLLNFIEQVQQLVDKIMEIE